MAEIAGLKLIVPSSVAGSGVSVSASGKVTFTAATSVSVNGCFSADYDNYLVVCRHVYDSSGNTSFNGRVRASGTDNSTASSYVRQRLTADSTTVAGTRSTADAARFSVSADNANGTHLYFYGPYLAQPTAIRSVSGNGNSGAYIEDNAVTHNQSTAYDGFTVYPGANTITGTLTIYGLSQ
jgi:hypothetical protein